MYTKNTFVDGGYRRELGLLGEVLAAKYLQATLGWTICEKNWRCKSGEIDIVAKSGNSIVFVEVRTRREGGRFGTAVESVDAHKLRQIKRVARIYICLHGEMQKLAKIRFDLIAIQVRNGVVHHFRHYRDIIC